MSLTGEVVDADRALRMGLVTEVVPHAELLPRAVGLAQSLSEVDPAVLGPVKQMYVQGWQATLGAGLAVETAIATTGRTDYSALEERRRAVLERNRSQL